MIYVIQLDDGRFLARQGSEQAYTKDLAKARGFSSREKAAQQGVCENERVRSVDDIIYVASDD